MVEFDRFIRGASLVFVFSMLANVAGMVARVLLAQGYRPVVFGRIMVGYTLFSFLGTLSAWGLNTALTYYLPKADDRGEEYELIFTATVIGLVISTVITVAAAIFNLRLATDVFGDSALSEYTIPFLLGVPVYVCLSIITGVFRGYESVRLKAYSKDLFYNISQVGIIILFIYLGIDGRLIGFVYLLSGIGAVTIGLFLLQRNYPPTGTDFLLENWTRLGGNGKRMVLYSTPIILVTLANWGLNYIDTFLIQILRGSANVGFYKAVYPIALTLITVLGAFGFLYLPSLSRLQSEGQLGEARKLYAVSTYIGFVLTVAPFLGIIFFTIPVIDLFYSAEYQVASVPLQLLAVGFFIEVIFGLNSASLNALGRTRANAVATGLAFIVNVILNVVLIPLYGLTGAAAATAAAILVWNLLSTGWLYYSEQLHPFTGFYLKGGVVAVALTTVLYYSTGRLFKLQLLQPALQLGVFAIIGTLSSICNLLILANTLPVDVVDDLPIPARLNDFLRIRR